MGLKKRKNIKKRLGILLIGIIGDRIFNEVFDWLLYPAVLTYFQASYGFQNGTIWGGLTMMFISFIVCYLYIIFYDWAEEDWLGIESVKQMIKDVEVSSFWKSLLKWTIEKGSIMTVILLSIKFDPFVTVVYLRKGHFKYDGLNRRDWSIFLLSTIISNVFWTIIILFGLETGPLFWILSIIIVSSTVFLTIKHALSYLHKKKIT